MKFRTVKTFATLTSVVSVCCFGRSGSLPRCARILSGLRVDFLRGVGKLTSFSNEIASRISPLTLDISRPTVAVNFVSNSLDRNDHSWPG